MTIDTMDLMNILLDGSLYDCCTIPVEIAERLKPQDTEGLLHFEDMSPPASYCKLWTKQGWDAECHRRIWLGKIREPIVQAKPTKASLEKEFLDAAMKGDTIKAGEIAAKIKELYG